MYIRQFGPSSFFGLPVRPGAEDKVGLIIDLLKPAEL
jgi:hypothetical protein